MNSRISLFGLILILFSLQVDSQELSILLDSVKTYSEVQDFASAQKVLERGLEQAKANPTPNDTLLAEIMYELAMMHHSQRNYNEGERYSRRVLALQLSIYGPIDKKVSTTLIQLANAQTRLDRPSEAAANLKQALQIRCKLDGRQSVSVAQVLINLAIVEKMMGDLVASDSLYEEAAGLFRSLKGPDDMALANCLNNMADNSARRGLNEQAEQRYRESLRIKRVNLGEDHWSIATTLNRLAIFYRSIGELTKAETAHLEALGIELRVMDPFYPSIANTYCVLGELYIEMDQLDKADSLFLKAVAIYEQNYGVHHSMTLFGYELLSLLRREQGRPGEAMKFAEVAARGRLNYVEEHLAYMPESDALSASVNMRLSVANYLASYLEAEFPDATATLTAAELIVRSKGIVTGGIHNRDRLLAGNADSTTKVLVEELKLIKQELAHLFVNRSPGDSQSRTHAMDSLRQEEVQIEAKLARSGAAAEAQPHDRIDAERISERLPQNSILIEFLRFDDRVSTVQKTEPGYLALLMTPANEPKIVNLGAAPEIESAIESYRRHMTRISNDGGRVTQADMAEFDQISHELYQLVWSPVAEYVESSDQLIIAPDGALNLFSFAGIRNENGKYLIESKSIHYFSAGRDILKQPSQRVIGQGLLAMGDPDFNATGDDKVLPGPIASAPVDVGVHYATAVVRSKCGDIADLFLSRLPGTRNEILEVVNLWQASESEPVTVLLGSEASEEGFRSNAVGARIIHLATHGYFLDGVCGDDEERLRGIDLQENPLLRSGLFLAGANRLGNDMPTDGKNDGVLTAYEVSELDLSGTELVILAGCETSLGDVVTGEGVFGLRRAFQMAGVQTQISSFWPIPDRSVGPLITRLYSRGSMSWSKLVQQIQIELIGDLRQAGVSDHPVEWGVFGVLGRWQD